MTDDMDAGKDTLLDGYWNETCQDCDLRDASVMTVVDPAQSDETVFITVCPECLQIRLDQLMEGRSDGSSTAAADVDRVVQEVEGANE